ncbi:hypothetical protein HB13667_07920 [Pseudomonas putida]|uniref:Uncharacterized protein n=1 Tax=Pseudomonas putida TaxID=303 RepID=A0A0P7D9Q1_PSEPU|nr:hypothetical protein HB13667_07920 [Pseudomonas putida]
MLREAAGRQVELFLPPALADQVVDAPHGWHTSIGVFFVDPEGMTTSRCLLPRYTPQGLPVDLAMAAAYFTAGTGWDMVAIMAYPRYR